MGPSLCWYVNGAKQRKTVAFVTPAAARPRVLCASFLKNSSSSFSDYLGLKKFSCAAIVCLN